MFKFLNEKEMAIVIGAMEPHESAPGDTVIEEGGDGNCIYVVEKGELDCSKIIAGESKFLKQYS